MNILYSCDDKYCPYTGISIVSLFENNKDLDEINVFIAGFDISEENRFKLEQTAKKYGRTIKILNTDVLEDFLKNHDVNEYHGSKAPMYRVFIERLIPENIERILYIDSDTIISGYIGELETLPFNSDKACAMVRAHILNGYNSLIGIKEDDLYYCTAVTLFDIENWKKLDCSARLMQAIKEGHANYPFRDQDLICRTINENIQTLAPKYDVFHVWAYHGVQNYFDIHDADEKNFYSVQEIYQALENPAILHCAAGHSGAPWQKGNKNPFKKEWLKYKAISLWKDIGETEMDKNFSRIMQRTLIKIVPRTLYNPIQKFFAKLYYKKYFQSL